MNQIIVLGAASIVGRDVLELVGESNVFKDRKVIAVDELAMKGKEVSFGEGALPFHLIDEVSFSPNDIVFATVPNNDLGGIYRKIVANGAVLIDASGQFWSDEKVPLVVSGVNIEDVAGYEEKGVVAVPSDVVVPIVVPILILSEHCGVKRVVASVYQAVSTHGKKGMDELYNQTKKMFEASSYPPSEFPRQIAFNCIPKWGEFLDSGQTSNEEIVANQVSKILKKDIGFALTCVTVPVFNCHGICMNVELEEGLNFEEVRELFFNSSSVLFFDTESRGDFKTPAECAKIDVPCISRLRIDPTIENGLQMWVVADNIRSGCALNMVNVAKAFVAKYLS